MQSPVAAILLAASATLGAQTATAPVPMTMGGEMIYTAGSMRITECVTGRNLPVAQEGDTHAMERAYIADVQSPGAPLYVTLEGQVEERARTEGAGNQAAVVVQRFINSWPGLNCERARAQASLENTHWKIVRLGGNPLRTMENRREPALTLQKPEQGGPDTRSSYSATIGCNQLAGAYDLKGNALAFVAGMSTLMACPPPLGDLEKRLAGTLENTRHWQVTGPTLELSDDAGESLALLEAVYVK